MSARDFTIIDAIRDHRLFGPAFLDLSTWGAWLAFLAALFALPLTEAEAEVWRACTGRSSLPATQFSEAWLMCGPLWQELRDGAARCVLRLLSRLRCFLGPGVAADRKQARVVLRFVRGLLRVPVLSARVVNDTAESIELEGDAVIEVITASHAVRLQVGEARWAT
jgi:hypothetical protein